MKSLTPFEEYLKYEIDIIWKDVGQLLKEEIDREIRKNHFNGEMKEIVENLW